MNIDPAEFPRRILLVVTGLSPQVVTETLYSLVKHPRSPVVPTEIRVITTARGAELVRSTLLDPQRGWVTRLCADYGLPAVRFQADGIHVLPDAAGTPMDDIRTPQDNERAADFITDTVRQLTADEQTALHVSIAGGRKTMGFYLGYALSLYGRPQDRLSHVLVSQPFESSLAFFYPTPYSNRIRTQNGSSADSADARITLAEIPFVSLRHGLPPALLEGTSRFSESVEAARRALGPAELVIDQGGRTILAAGQKIRLPPLQLAFLSWIARRQREGQPLIAGPTRGVPEMELAEGFLAEYRRVIGEMGDDDRTSERLGNGMDDDFFQQTKAKVNRAINRKLAPAGANYQIQAVQRRPSRYGLGLESEQIHFRALNLAGNETPSAELTSRGAQSTAAITRP